MAKLAILAKRWTASGAGVCVLSHTNVARLSPRHRCRRQLSRLPLPWQGEKYPTVRIASQRCSISGAKPDLSGQPHYRRQTGGMA
ncbi:MAG: hypothetical protein ABJA20_06510, partial [Novosphingobium sp.]